MKISTLSSPLVVDILTDINGSLGRSYDLAHAELQMLRLDGRIEKTLWPQLLHHHVNQQIYDLGGMYPELVTDLPPNPRWSHHHVMASVEDLLMTFSAVPALDMVPRKAVHRSRYALRQRYFRISEPGFEIVPVPDPYDRQSLYIQVLYGPSAEDRRSHGFTVIRILDENDQYLPGVIDLDEYLAGIEAEQRDRELIGEDFQITAALAQEGVKQNALW